MAVAAGPSPPVDDITSGVKELRMFNFKDSLFIRTFLGLLMLAIAC